MIIEEGIVSKVKGKPAFCGELKMSGLEIMGLKLA